MLQDQATSTQDDRASGTGDANIQITPKVEDKFTPPTSDDLTQPCQNKLTRTASTYQLHEHQLFNISQQTMQHTPVQATQQEQHAPPAVYLQTPNNLQKEQQYQYQPASAPQAQWSPHNLNSPLAVSNYYPSQGMYQNANTGQTLIPAFPVNPGLMCPMPDNRYWLNYNDDLLRRARNSLALQPQIVLTPVIKSPNGNRIVNGNGHAEIFITPGSQINFNVSKERSVVDIGLQTDEASFSTNNKNCTTDGNVTAVENASHGTGINKGGSPRVVLLHLDEETTPKKRACRRKSNPKRRSSPKTYGRKRKSAPKLSNKISSKMHGHKH